MELEALCLCYSKINQPWSTWFVCLEAQFVRNPHCLLYYFSNKAIYDLKTQEISDKRGLGTMVLFGAPAKDSFDFHGAELNPKHMLHYTPYC